MGFLGLTSDRDDEPITRREALARELDTWAVRGDIGIQQHDELRRLLSRAAQELRK